MSALVISRHFVMQSSCPLYPRKRTLDAASTMFARCQKRALWHLFDHLMRCWQISSSEGYRNAHQCGTDDHHRKTGCPGRKPGMTRKYHSAKKQRYHGNSIGDSQRRLHIFKDEKGNYDRESGQDDQDANTQCTQPVAPGQSRARFGIRYAPKSFSDSGPAAVVEKSTRTAAGAHPQ